MVKISRNYIAIPPGATIKEQLVDRGMSQKEFALRMDMSEKHISKLVNGEVLLTIDTARKLEVVLGIPAQFWCNLESIYRENLAQVREEKMMDVDVEFAKKFPYKEMANNGWVLETSKGIERAANLRRYFEVVQLKRLQDSLVPAEIARRKISETEKSYYTLVAWAQKAKLEGRKVETKPIDVKLLIKTIPEFRKMTVMSPNEFCPQLQEKLADCGIAMIFLPYIGGSFLNGATFYDGNKIILGLTVKGKDADKFWFSFFHELAHIILGHLQKGEGSSKQEEKEADQYSENVLIPEIDLKEFIETNKITENTIISFAKKEEIDPGIVLGRLQKDGYVKSGRYKKLKKQYAIV